MLEGMHSELEGQGKVADPPMSVQSLEPSDQKAYTGVLARSVLSPETHGVGGLLSLDRKTIWTNNKVVGSEYFETVLTLDVNARHPGISMYRNSLGGSMRISAKI